MRPVATGVMLAAILFDSHPTTTHFSTLMIAEQVAKIVRPRLRC
jgi:hypothetical protein